MAQGVTRVVPTPAPGGIPFLASGVTGNRCIRFVASSGGGAVSTTTPPDGGSIHGVCSGNSALAAAKGCPVVVEASAAFASGVSLATGADGRVRAAAGADVIVLTALEPASGAGSLVWAVFT